MKASAPVAGIVGLLLLAGAGYIEKAATSTAASTAAAPGVAWTARAGGAASPSYGTGPLSELDAVRRYLPRLDTGIDSELAALRKELEGLRSELDALRRAQLRGGGG